VHATVVYAASCLHNQRNLVMLLLRQAGASCCYTQTPNARKNYALHLLHSTSCK
jgi:hypothetical protein